MEPSIEDCDEQPETAECVECGGVGHSMGFLGSIEWFRCRNCGIDFNKENNNG